MSIPRIGSSAAMMAVVMTALFGTGCSSKYRIASDPTGATIYLNDKQLGQTPLEISFGDVPAQDNVRLSVVKEGHGSLSTILPGPTRATLGQEIFVTIPKSEADSVKINRAMNSVLKAYDLAAASRFSEALTILDEVAQEQPSFVYPHVLKASLLFRSKNFQGALAQYQKVLEIDPANREATKMIRFIKEGGQSRVPASPKGRKR